MKICLFITRELLDKFIKKKARGLHYTTVHFSFFFLLICLKHYIVFARSVLYYISCVHV